MPQSGTSLGYTIELTTLNIYRSKLYSVSSLAGGISSRLYLCSIFQPIFWQIHCFTLVSGMKCISNPNQSLSIDQIVQHVVASSIYYAESRPHRHICKSGTPPAWSEPFIYQDGTGSHDIRITKEKTKSTIRHLQRHSQALQQKWNSTGKSKKPKSQPYMRMEVTPTTTQSTNSTDAKLKSVLSFKSTLLHLAHLAVPKSGGL